LVNVLVSGGRSVDRYRVVNQGGRLVWLLGEPAVEVAPPKVAVMGSSLFVHADGTVMPASVQAIVSGRRSEDEARHSSGPGIAMQHEVTPGVGDGTRRAENARAEKGKAPDVSGVASEVLPVSLVVDQAGRLDFTGGLAGQPDPVGLAVARFLGEGGGRRQLEIEADMTVGYHEFTRIDPSGGEQLGADADDAAGLRNAARRAYRADVIDELRRLWHSAGEQLSETDWSAVRALMQPKAASYYRRALAILLGSVAFEADNLRAPSAREPQGSSAGVVDEPGSGDAAAGAPESVVSGPVAQPAVVVEAAGVEQGASGELGGGGAEPVVGAAGQADRLRGAEERGELAVLEQGARGLGGIDVDREYGVLVAAKKVKQVEQDAGGVRVNPLWYRLEDFPRELLLGRPGSVWHYSVGADGAISIGSEELISVVQEREWEELLAGILRRDPGAVRPEAIRPEVLAEFQEDHPGEPLPQTPMEVLKFLMNGLGHPTIALDFGELGMAVEAPGRVSGELVWNAESRRWEVNDKSGRYMSKKVRPDVDPGDSLRWLGNVARRIGEHFGVEVAPVLLKHAAPAPPAVIEPAAQPAPEPLPVQQPPATIAPDPATGAGTAGLRTDHEAELRAERTRAEPPPVTTTAEPSASELTESGPVPERDVPPHRADRFPPAFLDAEPRPRTDQARR
jgi:hypothetical protein